MQETGNIFTEDGKINVESLGENHRESLKNYVNSNYRDFIPEDIATDGVMSNVKDLHTFAKNYKEAQNTISNTRSIIPKDENDVVGWNNLYDKLGRPKEAAEYEYDKVEGFDDPDLLQKFSKVAHDNGLTKKQAKEALKLIQSELAQKETTNKNNIVSRLKSEWDAVKSEMGDTYDINVKKATAVLSKLASPEEIEDFKKKGFTNDVNFFRLLNKMAASMSEDSIGENDTKPSIYGPKEAMSRINDIRENRSNSLYKAYHDERDARHQEAVDEVSRLYKMTVKK